MGYSDDGEEILIQVIDADNIVIGTMPKHEAIKLARSMDLEFYFVRENVIKIATRQRLLAESESRYRQTVRKNRLRPVTEIKFNFNADENDYLDILSMTRQALRGGDIVKYLAILRGRENVYEEYVLKLMRRLISDLGEDAEAVRLPHVQGKSITTILKPKRQKSRSTIWDASTYKAYILHIEQKLRRRAYPRRSRVPDDIKAIVLFKIDTHGGILEVSLKETSYVSDFDEFCLQCVSRRGRFRPLPEEKMFQAIFTLRGVEVSFN